MTPPILESENEVTSFTFEEVIWPEQCAYRCHVCLVEEEDRGFSSIVLNLPGCGSCGDTEDEAIGNVRDAVLAVIESHRSAGEPIPWQDATSADIPNGAKQKWILVDA